MLSSLSMNFLLFGFNSVSANISLSSESLKNQAALEMESMWGSLDWKLNNTINIKKQEVKQEIKYKQQNKQNNNMFGDDRWNIEKHYPGFYDSDAPTSVDLDDMTLHIDGDYSWIKFLDKTDFNYDMTAYNWIAVQTIDNNKIIRFDGDDDYLERTEKIVRNYPFTLSAWIYYDWTKDDQVIISVADDSVTNSYFGIFIDDWYPAIRARNTSVNTKRWKKKLKSSQWYHVVWVFSSSTYRELYVDWEFVAKDQRNSIFNIYADKWDIWRRWDRTPKSYFNGKMDEIRIYDFALKSFDVKRLFNLGINSNSSYDTCFNVEYTKNEIKRCMVKRGNLLGTGTLQVIDTETIVMENEDLDLSESEWELKVSLAQKSKNLKNWKSAEFLIPEDVLVKKKDGNVFTWVIKRPEFLSKTIADELITVDVLTVVKVGNDTESLLFEDELTKDVYVEMILPVDELDIWDSAVIYSSEDQVTWNYLTSAIVSELQWDSYIQFETNHFTYFAVGTEDGSFLINNGDLSTDVTGVVLYNNVKNMSGMKFWNDTWELLLASWETFAITKNWALLSWNWTKYVYAMFEDNLWNTWIVQDSIILDAETNIVWIDYSVLPTKSGLALWFDADDLSTLETWVTNLISGWFDKGGNNYDAVQSVVASQPLYSTGVIKNKSAVFFDWVDDYFALKDISYQWVTAIGGLFACVVFRTDYVWWNYNRNRAFLDFDRSDFFDFYIRGDDGRVWFSTHGSSTLDNYWTVSYNDDEAHIACVSYDNSIVNDTQIIVDGDIELDQDTMATDQYLWKNTTRFWFIWDWSEATTFDGNRNDIYYDWYVAEMIYYENALNSWDQKELQCYLSNKRWIALNFSCDSFAPNASIDYDVLTITSGDVVATLTGYSENITIKNNWWSNQYIFHGNWSFMFLYEDASGNLWSTEAVVSWIDKEKPSANIEYSPVETTTWTVLAQLTWFSETGVIIINNAWSGKYLFEDNWDFVFFLKDLAGNTWKVVASVTWIENTWGVAYVIYDPDGPIFVSGYVVATLTWNNEDFVVTNNWWSEIYVFTWNWSFLFEYSYSGWTLTGTKNSYVNWIDYEGPSADVLYSPSTDTYWNVLATLINFSETWTVLNNSGSLDYVFTWNGSFDFILEDVFGNTWIVTATVDWIKSVPENIIQPWVINNVGPLEWETVYFVRNYSSTPYVFATPISYNNWDNSPVPLIRNITTNSFQIASCTDNGTSNCDLSANDEDYNYFVVDPNEVSSVSWMDVGIVSASANGSDTAVSFNKIFANNPYVWASSQTYSQWWINGLHVWIDDGTLSTNSMDLIGCVHDWSSDSCLSSANNETVAYLAIDVVNVNITWFTYGKSSISSSSWTNVAFGKTYIEPAIMVTQNSDNGWQDPQYPWSKSVSSSNADIRYCEQDWANDCDGHAAEDVVRFTLEATSPPVAEIVYNITGITNQDVIATLTGENEVIIMLNNWWNRNYVFTWNGYFVYEFEDVVGNKNSLIAEVDWIDKSLPNWILNYNRDYFIEDTINNDGTFNEPIIVSIENDKFVSDIENYVSFENLPVIFSGIVVYDSWTQISLFLTWQASLHDDSQDVNNIYIKFLTWAFEINLVSDVVGYYTTWIMIDFLVPFSVNGFFPIYDTTLDADTEPDNGCDNGICQEANYWAFTQSEVSDFGSVIISKYDLSSLPVWAKIYSASLKLTKYDYGYWSTSFKIKKIINNSGWIEWRGDAGGAGALQSLAGEPNFKQCKWEEENWNNWNPWFVEWSDYLADDLVDDVSFVAGGTETKTFYLNQNWVDALQDWSDNPENNQWFAFVEADVARAILATKESNTSSYRPVLTVNYLWDNKSPYLVDISPNNGETILPIDLDLSLTLNEYIKKWSGFLYIRRLTWWTLERKIDVWSGIVSIDKGKISIDLVGEFSWWVDYYVTIDSGFVRDVADNPFTGIILSGVWNFSTTDTDNSPVVTWSFATGVTQTTWILWWDIISTGTSIVTERWILWSELSSFSPSDANKVFETGSWNNIGAFSVPVTALPAGLWVYYRAYATNSYGIWYADISSFLMKPNNTVAHQAENVSNRSFSASWLSVLWADSYELYVATDSNFNDIVPWYGPKTPIYDISYSVWWIEPETQYFYKVVARNAAGVSFDSNTISLTTTYLPFPIMRLKLEESAWSIAYDSVSNHDAILDGTISFQQSWVDGNAFYLNWSEDQMTTIDFGYWPDLTLQFWFKDTSNTTTEYLFSHGDITDANSMNVILDGTDNMLKTYFNWQLLFSFTGQDYTDLLDGNWHMYTLTIDDNFAAGGKKKIAIYLDGVQVDVDADIVAWAFNPGPENLTMWRRSNNTVWTYYDGYLDDIRIYNTDLFDYEVKSIYDELYVYKNPLYVANTSPNSGEIDVMLDEVISIEFSKSVNHNSVEASGVVLLSPNLSGIVFDWTGNTLLISHDNFEYLTSYVVTISTGVLDLSWVNMDALYQFSFMTQNNIYITYQPTIFEEIITNNGIIGNSLSIVLTWDKFTTDVVSWWYVVVSNVPVWLTWVFVRDSDTQITFSLTWNALNHTDLDDVDNLSVYFSDAAFSWFLASEVSNSSKLDIYIDFNDPNSFGMYPVKDTTLDNLNVDYNYGIADSHFIWWWSYVAIEFDLTGLPDWATINSATLTFSKINGAGTWFYIGRLINNSGWVEWTKIWAAASDNETTYNERNYNIANWSGWLAGLVSGVDYNYSLLVDDVVFDSNQSRIFTLNAEWLSVLSGWFSDPDSNEWFLLYGGTTRFEIWAKENSIESLRPKLLISYTPVPVDYLAPILTWISMVPVSSLYNSWSTQNVTIDFDSSEYPIYLTYNLYSETGLLVYSTWEFYLVDSWSSIPDFIIDDWLSDGSYDLDFSVRDEANNISTWFIGEIIIDTIKPIAYTYYIPTSGDYNGWNVQATLTWFSEMWIVITNNWWNDTFVFTWNWSFLFEFVDLAGNTWEYLAIVDWIDTTPPVVTWFVTVPAWPILNTGVDEDIDIDFISDEYPLVYSFVLYDSWGNLVDSDWNYTINSSWDLPINYTFPGYGLSEWTYDLYLFYEDQYWNNWSWFVESFIVSFPNPWTLSIWSFSWISFTWIYTSWVQQAIESQVSDYFFVADWIWADSGYYTTISSSDLVGLDIISSWNVYIKWTGLDLLSGSANSSVIIDNSFTNYQALSWVLTYIKRDSASNSNVTWKYWTRPWVKIILPAYYRAWVYSGSLTYTLYEN